MRMDVKVAILRSRRPQYELAQAIGVSEYRLSKYVNGRGQLAPEQEAKLAEHEGYMVPESHILIDEGISGTTMDRPGLRKLRELVQTQAIAAAIVYDPDRLSRNLGHQLLLAEELERASVKLLIVSHPLEQGPEGWLFFQMRGALAEYERAKTLERTSRGKIGRAKAGHPPGGQVPLGYRAIREPHAGCWEIEPEEAALVRRIFAMGIGGMTMRGIARQLTAEGVPTKFDRDPFLIELKGYRAEIVERRQSLAARRAELQSSLESIVHHVTKVETLIDYCERVRRRLQTFDEAEKRLALDALDVRVTYMPGQPLDVQARIPLTSSEGEIVSPTSRGE